MNDTKSGLLALTIALSTAACGGQRAPSEPPGPFPTPAVHELARLQEHGELDQVRLACASVALNSMMPDLVPILPVLWSAGQPRWRRSGGSTHARSVQDGMAARDRSTAAMRRASQARATAAYADRVGDTRLATRSSNVASLAMRQAQSGPATTQGSAVWRPPTRWTDDDSLLLEEYAGLLAVVTSSDDVEVVEAAQPRLAEIGSWHPQIMEAYAGLLLQAYEDPDLACGEGGGA